MFIKFFHWFTKITAWPIALACFRTRVYCEDPGLQARRIRGPAIVICNHTSVFDYAVLMFVFFFRTLRCQASELIFRQQPLGTLMRLLGAIPVDRSARDFTFLEQSAQILRKGGVVEIYPESRIPRPGEQRPLEFKPSAAYLALYTGVKVIPVYTNGSYFSKKRARVIIGTPLDPIQYTREDLTDKENISLVNDLFRSKIMELEEMLHERINEKKEKTL